MPWACWGQEPSDNEKMDLYFCRSIFVFSTINNKHCIMSGIGFITTDHFDSEDNILQIPTDESVCGILFDHHDYFEIFRDYPLLENFFGNGQVQLINNPIEAQMFGIVENGFMDNVPYYHIKQFYNYIGGDAPLYVAFTDGKWDIIEDMQLAANGRIFQMGIWTSQYIWKNDANIGFTNLIGDISSAVGVVSGSVGVQTIAKTPLSVIVSPNTNVVGTDDMTLMDIPDGTAMDCPKVSVCLAQNGSDAVLQMQSAIPFQAPVGCIGMVLACCYLAYAEECIGYVAKFNLNKNDDFENAEVPVNGNHYALTDIPYTIGNILAQKGYIIPVQYDGKDTEVFFSGDATFSNGDYSTIANNRIMHKCRRCIAMAMLPYVNGNAILDLGTGGLSESSKTMLANEIYDILDATMVNMVGQPQIESRSIVIDDNKDFVQDDTISIDIKIGLVNYNKEINEKEDFEI